MLGEMYMKVFYSKPYFVIHNFEQDLFPNNHHFPN